MPAGDLRFEIIVDDRGTASIQKFERVSKGADKKVKESGKKHSKETAASWKKAHGQMSNSMSKWKTVALGAFAAVGGALLFRKVWKFTKESITAFAVQEDAEKRLADQMKIVGDYTEEAYQSHLKFASAIQEVTKYGDEETLMMMANLKTYGMSNETLQKATKMTMDLATAKGIDLRTASELVGKAFVGETGTLSRYGIIIDQSVPKTEKFTEVQRVMQKMFGGAAQAEVDTYAGRVAQLTNSWGDLKEKIGSAFIPALSELAKNLKSMVSRGDEWVDLNQEIIQSKIIEWAGLAAKGVGFLAKAVLGLRASWQLANLAFNKMAQETVEGIEWISDKLGLFLAVAGLVDPTMAKAANMLADLRDECNLLGKSFEEQGDEWSSAADRTSSAIDTLDGWINNLFDSSKNLRKESKDGADTFDRELTPALAAVAKTTKKDVIPSFEKAMEELEELKQKIESLKQSSDSCWPAMADDIREWADESLANAKPFFDEIDTEFKVECPDAAESSFGKGGSIYGLVGDFFGTYAPSWLNSFFSLFENTFKSDGLMAEVVQGSFGEGGTIWTSVATFFAKASGWAAAFYALCMGTSFPKGAFWTPGEKGPEWGLPGPQITATYDCPLCSASFKTIDALNRHWEHRHGGQYGIPFVSQEGPYWLHPGEQVLTKEEVKRTEPQTINLHIARLVIQAGGINFETQLFKEISMASKDGRLKIHQAASREF